MFQITRTAAGFANGRESRAIFHPIRMGIVVGGGLLRVDRYIALLSWSI
jgi:hypothetical protein